MKWWRRKHQLPGQQRKKNGLNILIKALYLQVVEIYAIDTDRPNNCKRYIKITAQKKFHKQKIHSLFFSISFI